MNYRQAYYGDWKLRMEVANYLSATRSIQVPASQVLITRGSVMSFYLLFQNLLTKNDWVIASELGFNEGLQSVELAGGRIARVPIDHEGMDIDAVEAFCRKQPVKAVFIVPHHQYPTTVSLSAERRMRLLQLAEKYGFWIIEDDYDYDFHYASSPILPMASADYGNSVAYVGSFSKILAPSLRVGFIVAPLELVDACARLSKYIDSYGNTVLERAIALLVESGEIRRHLKKATKVYKQRRDLFCELLKDTFGAYAKFERPEGGLAVWTAFQNGLQVGELVRKAQENNLKLAGTASFASSSKPINATRMGFASLNEKEMQQCFEVLRNVLKSM